MRISDWSSDVCSSDLLLAETEADRLRYPPGAGWAYSNIGYMKAGALIAQASGLPLGVALQQLVFAPAGLTSARLALEPAALAGFAMGAAQGSHPGWEIGRASWRERVCTYD